MGRCDNVTPAHGRDASPAIVRWEEAPVAETVASGRVRNVVGGQRQAIDAEQQVDVLSVPGAGLAIHDLSDRLSCLFGGVHDRASSAVSSASEIISFRACKPGLYGCECGADLGGQLVSDGLSALQLVDIGARDSRLGRPCHAELLLRVEHVALVCEFCRRDLVFGIQRIQNDDFSAMCRSVVDKRQQVTVVLGLRAIPGNE